MSPRSRRLLAAFTILLPLIIALTATGPPAEGIQLSRHSARHLSVSSHPHSLPHQQCVTFAPTDTPTPPTGTVSPTAPPNPLTPTATSTATLTVPVCTPTPTPTSTPTPIPPTATPTSTPVVRGTITPTPTATNPAIVLTELVQNGGFENGQAPWIEFSAGNYQLINATKPHSGSFSAWFCGGNGCNDQLYQTVTIPTAFASITFSFWIYVDTQDTSTSCKDMFTAQLRLADGTPLTTVATKCNTDATNSWVQVTADVSGELRSFAGQKMQVYFQGTTDQSGPTDFFLDDVSLAAETLVPTPTLTPTNTSTPTNTPLPTNTPTFTPTPVPSIQITRVDLWKSARGVITDTCDVVLAAGTPLKKTTLLYPNQTGILRVLYQTVNAGSNAPQGQVVYMEKGKAVDGDFLLPGTTPSGPFMCVAISFTGKGVHHYDAKFTLNLGSSAANADLFFTVGKCAHGTTGSKGQCVKCAKGYKLKSGKCQKVARRASRMEMESHASSDPLRRGRAGTTGGSGPAGRHTPLDPRGPVTSGNQ